MIKIDEFKRLFKSGSLEFDENYLIYKSDSEGEFLSLFPNEVYKTSKFDDVRCEGTIDVSEFDFIFSNLHDFISAVDKEKHQGDEVYLREEGFLEVGNFYNAYKKWLELFSLASEHHYKSESPNNERTIIFVDGSGSTEVLKLDFESFPSDVINNLVNNISDPSLLLDSFSQEDAHQNEKLSVLKTSIIKWVKENKCKNINILTCGGELLNIFHLNYETYLRSFSFDEFIKDLEDDVSDFINNVEEQVQGFYLQALTVPGAVILASALRVAEKSLNFALIFSAGLALYLVFRSLKTKIKFISRISENTKFKLQVYQRRVEDISNDYAKKSISEKLESSVSEIEKLNNESTKEIEKVKDIIIACVVTYIIFSVVFMSGG